jgi:TPR repeat protein
MKQCILFPLVVIFLSSPILIALPAPQASHPTQIGPDSTSQPPKTTEADAQTLLAKAQRGDRKSQMWLGAAYEQGWLGKTNFEEALKWFRRAAAQGDPDAQNSLGQMYADGEGVQRNYTLAAKWYRRAAGHVPDLGGAGQGRNNLGLLYMDGLGVPKDYVRAYMWFRLANFDPNLSYARAKMTRAQILKAEQMATEWRSHHPEN